MKRFKSARQAQHFLSRNDELSPASSCAVTLCAGRYRIGFAVSPPCRTSRLRPLRPRFFASAEITGASLTG